MGDSTCTIAACDINTNALQPFFSNHVVEIIDTMRTWASLSAAPGDCELDPAVIQNLETDCVVDELLHIPGTINVADMATRGNVELEEIGQGSTWQIGPDFIREDRSTWPVTRDFVRHVPEAECRKKFLLTAMALNNDMKKHKVMM